MNQPLDPAKLAEFQKIHDELRAIQADAEQRHAQITAKTAQDAVRGTTHNTTRTLRTPAETAREAVRGTTAGQGASTPQGQSLNPSQTAQGAVKGASPNNLEGEILQNGADTALDMADTARDTGEKLRSNAPEKSKTLLQSWRDRYQEHSQQRAADQKQLRLDIKTEQQRFEKEHPKIAALEKVAEEASRAYARRTPLGRAREILAFGVRTLDPQDIQTAKELASTYGKDIREFIVEAKETARKAAKEGRGGVWRREDREKPFFERENDRTKAKIDKISQQLGRENKKLYDKDGRLYPMPENAGKIRDLEQEKNTLKSNLTLEHALSERAHKDGFAQKFQAHKEVLAHSTREQVGNYLVGTPQERYDALLYNATHHLGEKHFDVSLNPRSGLDFDRFAASRLFQDGWEVKEVRQTLENSPFRQVFGEEPHKGDFYEGKGYRANGTLLEKYDEQVNQFHHRENLAIQENVKQFQKSKGGRILEAKINPHDAAFQKKIGENLEKWQSDTRGIVHAHARQTLKEYSDARGQIPEGKDFSTDYQYRLELGRWLEKGENPEDAHKLIGVQLRKAGHDEKDIMEAFREYNASLNDSTRQTKAFQKASDQILSEEKHLLEWDKTNQFKQQHGIEGERRLDRLDLHNSYRYLEGKQPMPSPSPTKDHENSSPRTQETEHER